SKPRPIHPSTAISTRTTRRPWRASSGAWAKKWAKTWVTIWAKPWRRRRRTRAACRRTARAPKVAAWPVSARPVAMKVEVLTGFEGLDESRWNGLLAEARYPSVFLSWQWQTAWARAFLGSRPLHLLRVTDDAGALAGVLPLYDESPGLRRFVGGVDVSDYL